MFDKAAEALNELAQSQPHLARHDSPMHVWYTLDLYDDVALHEYLQSSARRHEAISGATGAVRGSLQNLIVEPSWHLIRSVVPAIGQLPQRILRDVFGVK